MDKVQIVTDVINNRRSVRKYADKPVEPEKIEAVLRAAMQAPSAGNQRPWEFLVIQERAALEELAGMHQYAKPVAGAAFALVLMADHENLRFADNWQQDMGAAAQTALLEIAAQDLGAVWMAIWPDPTRVDYVREHFGLPEHIKPFAVISAGYPAEPDANHFVDRYEEARVHFERY